MFGRAISRFMPSWQNSLLALVSAVMLILAFPDFDWWWLAWFALAPLLVAIEREGGVRGSFLLGWLFGTVFFFGTCWWLTFAPITYAAFPWWLAYFLLLIVCGIAGLFPAIFAAILSFLLKRIGTWAFLAAPFVWVFTEFLRYWMTGNNWNAIGYSQAFSPFGVPFGRVGGVLLVGFLCLISSSLVVAFIRKHDRWTVQIAMAGGIFALILLYSAIGFEFSICIGCEPMPPFISSAAQVVAIQPNVPMSGIDSRKLTELRRRQFEQAESEIRERWKLQRTSDLDRGLRDINDTSMIHLPPITVILPESPMNFMYNDDREFQQYVRDFTTRNNVSLIFNSAEPDPTNGKYFNSAMMIGPDGKPAAQYDKIYLLPFGEAVPLPLDGLLPGFVGNFSYGSEYDILPIGDAKAGIMICFESHFGQLGREYVRNGADVLIEMTNDGYLGPTPVLRQHLANAVFRAVETNRPVIRATNVGITAYINERGEVLDAAPAYQTDSRVWTVSKSDGSQTFYVKYGDWFAWLCVIVTIGLMGFAIRKRLPKETE